MFLQTMPRVYKPTNQKWREVVGSPNFSVNLIALVLFIMSGAGVELPTGEAGEYFGQLEQMIAAAVLWIYNPIRDFTKRVISKEVDWSFLKNSNSITAFVSVAAVIAGIWLSEETVATLTAVATNLLNLLFQTLMRPAKLEG